VSYLLHLVAPLGGIDLISSTFYGLTSSLNVAACIYFCAITYRDSRHQNKSFWKAFLSPASDGVRLAACCIFAFLYLLPLLLFRCLPIYIKSRVRFARRYGLKASQGLKEKSEMKMKTLTNRPSGKGKMRVYESKSDGERAGLADFLAIYDILLTVVENLHYVDLVNLGQVSRSVREAVCPSDSNAQRMIHFKMYACHRETKWECWSCLNLICQVSPLAPSIISPINLQDCKYSRALAQTTPCFHLDNCCLFCTKCYYKTVQQPSSIASTKRYVDPRYCKCAPATPTPNIVQRWLHSLKYYSRSRVTLPYITRQVCGNCRPLSDVAILEKRLERTKWDLKHTEGSGTRGVGTDNCKNCDIGLGNGPRWLVCKLCKKECRSTLHRAWNRGQNTCKREEIV
jgi:hypothetical protein